ncbi:MAG: HNH endonuclease [Phycisphaerales bacterium]
MTEREHEFPTSVKEKAFKRQGGVCAYCGIQLDPPSFIHDEEAERAPHRKLVTGNAHHVKPDSHGGSALEGNCVYLCRNCHAYLGHGALPKRLKGVAPHQGGDYKTWVKLRLRDLRYAYGRPAKKT